MTAPSSTGAVSSTSNVPLRFSSLNNRMVNTGTATMVLMTADSCKMKSRTIGSGSGSSFESMIRTGQK